MTITISNCTIDAPTAITPDGDKINDTWELIDIDANFPQNVVSIYDRWGTKVFESIKGNYQKSSWDGTYNGKALPVDSYYYIIEFNDGQTESANGIVTIILQK
jgi:gliding motility-associated-like protein